MNRIFILYVIFIIIYSLIKGKKKKGEEEVPSQGEAPSPPPFERDEEEELDIFSLPLELEDGGTRKEEGGIPPPFIPPTQKPRPFYLRRKKEEPIQVQTEEKRRTFNLREGIIMAEILGPPRSRQPYSPIYKRR